MDRPAIFALLDPSASRRRARRALVPTPSALEDRRLLTASAAMSQTALFPDLEANPNLATQGLLYFSPAMGTLTEVDIVTSGSFTSQFSGANQNSSATGSTSANLAISLPTGPISVTIPTVQQNLNGPAVTSNSAPQTTVLTTPAELAAFTGHFRLPVAISGHAEGTTSTGQAIGSFQTDTSATISVIYHYIPNLTVTSPGSSASGPVTPTSGASGNIGTTGSATSTTSPQSPPTESQTPAPAPLPFSTMPTSTGARHHRGFARSVRDPRALHRAIHVLARDHVRSAHHPTQAIVGGHRHRIG